MDQQNKLLPDLKVLMIKDVQNNLILETPFLIYIPTTFLPLFPSYHSNSTYIQRESANKVSS